MQKILMLVQISTTDWGSKNQGGLDSVCQMLVQHLQEHPSKDFYYRVVAFDPTNSINDKQKVMKLSESLEVVQFNCSYKGKRGVKLPGILYQLKKTLEQISDFSPNLIHSHQMSLGLASLRVPTLITLHSYKKIARARRSLLNNLLFEKIVPALSPIFSDGYTCVSQSLATIVKKDYQRHITTIYNPIDSRFFDASVNSSERALTLVTCALLTERKGIHHIIEVLALLKKTLPTIQLKIIGPPTDQNYVDNLNCLIQDKNLTKNITFLGKKDIYSIINEYENSDIGIFLSAEETFGLVPLEMLASGLPVVCSETGIMSDLCKNNITLDSLEIVNADHYQDIAKRILSLVRHCKQTTLNKSTHFIKKNFSTSVISKAYELEYQQILGHRK